MSNIAIVLLAAGNSSRMGSAKQLLDFRGNPMLRHAAETALASGCSPVVVVLGARAVELQAALDGLAVEIALNERWQEGMGTSIQAGLRALDGLDLDGAIIALADQPFIAADMLAGLPARHFATGKSIIAARYSGTVGVPVFFGRAAFPLLQALEPQQGCKGVILGNPQDHILVDCPEAAIDIDTPDDYKHALGAEADFPSAVRHPG